MPKRSRLLLILNAYLVYRLLVDLHAVDREARARVELLVANVTFEVLGFLVLNQDLFIVKFPVAIPAEKFAFLKMFSRNDIFNYLRIQNF